MKLKTMLAVVAGALGLCASAAVELPDGVSFEQEAKVVQPSEITEAKGATWEADDAENTTLEVKAYGAESVYPYTNPDNARNTMFDAQANYLSVKTKIGSPLNRKAEVEMKEGVYEGVYFDSLVKFTACDEAPAADSYSDAKLVAYVFEDETNGTTNFFVRAVGGDYNLGAVADIDNWHRLTIKAIPGIYKGEEYPVPGFAIYLDGNSVTATDTDYATRSEIKAADLTNNAKVLFNNKNLFVSLNGTSKDYQKITSVGFDGQGAIDDLAFTTTAPVTAAADLLFATVKIGEKIASFMVDGQMYTTNADAQIIDGKVAITAITHNPGYFGPTEVNLDATSGGELPLDNEAKTLVATIGDAPYASIEEALAEAGDNAVIVLQAKDITATNSIVVNKSVTIDLNGKTVTGAAGANVFTIDAAVTFVDSGETGKVVAVQAGEGTEAVYAVALVEEPAGTPALTITGGTFTGAPENADFDLGFDVTPTITGGWFLNDPSTFLEDTDYEATIDETHDDYYKVTKVEKKGWAIYLAGAGTPEAPYEIKDEDDLIELAKYMHTTEEFPTEDVVFQLQNDIPMTKPFAGIGVGNAKDLVSWTIGTEKGNITADVAESRIAAFNAGAFKGTFDGNNFKITNLQLVCDDNHGDYAGFIQSALGATIKNLTIGVNETSLFSPNEGDRGGAIIAGVTVNTTIENCQTLAGSVSVNKAEAGIVGYACGGTVIKACTNNLAITTSNEKVGGIVACAQKGASKDSKLVFGDGTLVIEDCTNNGNLTSTAGTDKGDYTSGIASYGDIAITFKGDISNTGTLTSAKTVYTVCAQNGGSLTVDDGATFHVQAAYKAVRTACDGFNFGTVNGEWITFVKDADVASGMRVMAANAPVTLAADASITLDQTVATPKVTVPDGYYDAITGSGAEVTHTATAKTDYSAAVLALASESADWTDKLEFPAYTVKVGSDDVPSTAYEAVWDPESIAAMAAGDADKVYTLTVTIKKDDKVIVPAAALTKIFTVKAPAAGGDIPADPEKDITEDTKPTDLGLDANGPFKDAGKDELIKLSKWANKFDKKAADINAGVKFDNAGNPTTEMAEAYLLNCGVDGVEDAKKAFKFNADDLAAVLAADPTSLTTLNGNSYNGAIQVKAFSDAACKTPAEGDLDAKFYKAVLVK